MRHVRLNPQLVCLATRVPTARARRATCQVYLLTTTQNGQEPQKSHRHATNNKQGKTPTW